MNIRCLTLVNGEDVAAQQHRYSDVSKMEVYLAGKHSEMDVVMIPVPVSVLPDLAMAVQEMREQATSEHRSTVAIRALEKEVAIYFCRQYRAPLQ